MKRTLLLLASLPVLAALGSRIGAAHDMGTMHRPAVPQACTELAVECAATITPYVGPDGTLWLVGRVGDRLFVEKSGDGGKSLSPPAAIDTGAVTLDWGPDERPQLAVAEDGTIVLVYATFRDDKYDGEVFVSRSTDHGRSFSKPEPITDLQESQRFPALAFLPDGTLFTAWLDKRGRIAAKARGEAFPGAGLAVARSTDHGAHVGQAAIVRENTCECCRIALALTPVGRPVVLFRNIFPVGVRDHAVVTFDAIGRPGPLHRVSVDDWKTQVCPHQGPSLAIAADGAYHAAWYTQGSVRHGLFYAHSDDGGVTWSAPMPLAAPGEAVSRPFVLASGGTVRLAWKSFDGQTTRVMTMRSRDGGKHWDGAHVVSEVEGASDHPILLEWRGRPFLSWQTSRGYRLLSLGDAP